MDASTRLLRAVRSLEDHSIRMVAVRHSGWAFRGTNGRLRQRRTEVPPSKIFWCNCSTPSVRAASFQWVQRTQNAGSSLVRVAICGLSSPSRLASTDHDIDRMCQTTPLPPGHAKFQRSQALWSPNDPPAIRVQAYPACSRSSISETIDKLTRTECPSPYGHLHTSALRLLGLRSVIVHVMQTPFVARTCLHGENRSTYSDNISHAQLRH